MHDATTATNRLLPTTGVDTATFGSEGVEGDDEAWILELGEQLGQEGDVDWA